MTTKSSIRNSAFGVFALYLAACGGPAVETPGSQADSASSGVLQMSIDALGGPDVLHGDNLINVTAQGVSVEPHQDGDEMDELENIANTYTAIMTNTLSGERVHVDYRYQFRYPFPYNGNATMIVNGKEGSVHGIDGFQARYFGLVLPRPMYSRRLEALSKTWLMGNPYMLIRRIIDQNGIDAVPVDGAYQISLHDELPPVRVELDPATGLPWRASATERDYLFGDVEYVVQFEDWQPVAGGGTYPRRIDHSLDGFTVRAEDITDVSFGDGQIDEFTFVITSKRSTYLNIENPYIVVDGYDAEEGRRGLEASQWSMRMLAFGFSQDLPVDAVVITKENTSRNRRVDVPGNVYMLEGNTELMAYASVVVDSADGIYVIESPLHEYRSEVAIAAIKERFPGKPLLGVIVTHHHMDHIGGLRTYAAETGRVYAAAGGRAFIGGALELRDGVFQDSLDRAKTNVEVVAVNDKLVVGEGADAFELIAYPTSHSDDVLVIYFPAIKALALGDVFNGEMIDGLNFYNDGTKEILAGRAGQLRNFIAERGLEVEYLLTVHGGAVVSNEIDGFLEAGI